VLNRERLWRKRWRFLPFVILLLVSPGRSLSDVIGCRVAEASPHDEPHFHLSPAATEVKVVFRVVPIACTATTITIDMPPDMMAYSMAGAPASSFRKIIVASSAPSPHRLKAVTAYADATVPARIFSLLVRPVGQEAVVRARTISRAILALVLLARR
jgi:hypothetical protein